MKISLNKEYAIRHLGVAALFFGLSLYFLYDAIFVYPYLPADGAHHTTVEFQYTSAALLALMSFVVGFCKYNEILILILFIAAQIVINTASLKLFIP